MGKYSPSPYEIYNLFSVLLPFYLHIHTSYIKGYENYTKNSIGFPRNATDNCAHFPIAISAFLRRLLDIDTERRTLLYWILSSDFSWILAANREFLFSFQLLLELNWWTLNLICHVYNIKLTVLNTRRSLNWISMSSADLDYVVEHTMHTHKSAWIIC